MGSHCDTNVISTKEEKIGGRPHRLEESMDFIDCLNDCELQDVGFTGLKVTWGDHRDPLHTIWKRFNMLPTMIVGLTFLLTHLLSPL